MTSYTGNDHPILFCLGRESANAKASAINRWTDDDWNALFQQAATHGVSAYLYHRLKTLEQPVNIPPSIDRSLHEITLLGASWNLRLYHQLSKMAAEMNEADIPVILLKGIHLAKFVYAHIALRSMCDIDVMVRKEDVHRAIVLLMKRGFYLANEKTRMYYQGKRRKQYVISPQNNHFPQLHHPDWPLNLEVHKSLLYEEISFRIDTDGLWDRRAEVNLDGIKASILSPEDSLLHQSLHVSYHHLFKTGIKPFCDIYETVRRHRDQLNWDRVISRAKQWGMSRCLYVSLALTRDLFGAVFPNDVIPALGHDDSVDWAVRKTKKEITTAHRNDYSLPPKVARYLSSRKLDGIGHIFIDIVFPSRRKLVNRYGVHPNSIKIFIYYFIRIKDILKSWGRTGIGFFKDGKISDEKIKAGIDAESERSNFRRWLSSKD